MVSRQLSVGVVIGVSIAFLLTTMNHLHKSTPVRSVHLQSEARLNEKLDNVIKNITINNKLTELEAKLREESQHHNEEVKKNEELLKKQEELLKEKEELIKKQEVMAKEHELAKESAKDNQNEILQKLADLKKNAGDHADAETLAEKLKKKIKVLVWVMTQPKNLQNQALAVKETWGKRANKILFMSSKTDPDFPTIGLDVAEGRDHLTAKTMQAFKYVYENHFDDYDWFMKADDDTFVIMENLRFFLSAYNTSEPIYFGHLFQALVKQGYYSGGAGYVLSKEALRRLYTRALDPSVCTQDGGPEDGNMGKCMEKLGVKTTNSSDSLGRSRFHTLDAAGHLRRGRWLDWMYRFEVDGDRVGADTISDYAISFHYIRPKDMYLFELFLYKIRNYGVRNVDDDSLNVPQENRLLKPDQNLDYDKMGCVFKRNCQQLLKAGLPWN